MQIPKAVVIWIEPDLIEVLVRCGEADKRLGQRGKCAISIHGGRQGTCRQDKRSSNHDGCFEPCLDRCRLSHQRLANAVERYPASGRALTKASDTAEVSISTVRDAKSARLVIAESELLTAFSIAAPQ